MGISSSQVWVFYYYYLWFLKYLTNYHRMHRMSFPWVPPKWARTLPMLQTSLSSQWPSIIWLANTIKQEYIVYWNQLNPNKHIHFFCRSPIYAVRFPRRQEQAAGAHWASEHQRSMTFPAALRALASHHTPCYFHTNQTAAAAAADIAV